VKRLATFLVAVITLWLALALPAHAGPLLTAVGAMVVNLGAIGQAAVGFVANLVLTTLVGAFFGPKEPKDKGIKERMDNGADKPPKLVFGKYGVPGHLLYHNSFFGTRNIYVEVIILCAKPVNGLSNLVRIAGRNCVIDDSTVDADGFSPVVEYEKNGKQYAKVKFHPGGQNAADPFLVATFGDDPDWAWTNAMIVKGCAYVIVQSLYSRKGVWAGTPDYFWTVDGMPMYDPRRDSTVGGSGAHRWNDESTWGGPGDYNPHVQKYNIIRGIRDIDGSLMWGGRAEAYRLPLDYWFAAMNAADENIEKKNGDIVKRYQTGLEVELTEQPFDIVIELDRSSSSYTTEYGGTYKTWCGGPGLSVLTITDNDFYITEKKTDDLFKPVKDTYNSGVATYPEPRSGWSMEPGPIYVDDDYLADDDNDPNVLDVQLRAVTENNQAQRLIREMIKDSRGGIPHQGTLPPEAAILEPHDRISYISTDNGYHGDGVDFLIGSKVDNPDVSQFVSLKTINPDAFTWVKEMELDHTTGHMGVIRPGALAVTFDITPDTVDTENGKDKPAAYVTWDWADIDVDVDRILWQARRTGTTRVIAHGTIHNVWDGEELLSHHAFRFRKDYDFRFYAMPISDREADWLNWQGPITMVDLTKPNPPTLQVQSILAADSKLDYYLKMSTAAVTGEVTYVFEVTEVSDGNIVRRHPQDVPRHKIGVSTGDQFSVRVAVKAADGGTLGDFSDPTTITITKKAANNDPPTGLTATGKAGKIIYKATRSPTQKDFKKFNYYVSDVNDFSTATLLDDTPAGRLSYDDLDAGVTKYAWVSTVDTSDNESTHFPVSATAGRAATTKGVGDGDVDGNSPNAPAAPALSTFTGELTGDNVVDTGLSATLTAPAVDATHPAALEYDIEVWRSSTLGGTYTFWRRFRADELTYPFKADPDFFYKARARGRSFANRPGTYGALTAVGVQPLQYLASIPQPAAPAVTPKGNGFHIKVAKPSLGNWAETILFANGVEIDRKRGTVFNDNTARTVGDSVTYTAQYVDTQDRVGLVSSGTAVTYRPVQDADIDQNAPNAPGVPSLTTFTAELTGDKAVDTGLLAATTAPAVDATHPAAKKYVFEIWRSATLGGTYTYWKKWPSDDLDIPFPASTEWFYKARAKGISTAGKHGAFSALTAAGVQPLQYLASIPQPAAPTVTAKSNGFHIKVAQPSLGNWKETILFADGVEIDRKRGSVFNDNSARTVGASVNYTAQYVDSQDRVGLVSSGTAVTYRAVQDADIDQNAPNAPGVPSLTTFTAELTGDNTVDTGLLATTTAPAVDATHPAARKYVFEIWRSSTLAGTYTYWKKWPSDDLDIPFPASSEWFYKARAKGISTAGKHGAFSALTAAGVQPLQFSTTVPQPAAPTVTPKGNGFHIKVAQPSLANWKETILFANGVEIDRKRGTVFNDNTARASNAAVTYTAQYVDSQDRVGLVSSGTAVNYRLIQGSDVGPGQIADSNTDQSAPATPGTGPTIAPVSAVSNKDGTIDVAMKMTAPSLPSGAKTIEFAIDFNYPGSPDLHYFAPKRGLATRSPMLLAGKQYAFYYRGVSFNEVDGSLSPATLVTPAGKTTGPADPTNVNISASTARPFTLGISWDDPPEADYDHSEIARLTTIGAPTDANILFTTQKNNNEFFYAEVTTFYWFYVRHVNTSGVPSNWVRYTVGLINAATVKTSHLAANAVTVEYDALVTASTLHSAGVEVQYQLTAVNLTDAYFVMFYIEFTNDDGSFGRNFDIKLYTDTPAVIMNRTGINTSDQGMISLCWPWAPTQTGVHNFNVGITCPGTTHVKARRVMAIVFKR
jgi:hypothetical protein